MGNHPEKTETRTNEGRSVLFNDSLNTFYIRLYSSKGSFICIIPQTGFQNVSNEQKKRRNLNEKHYLFVVECNCVMAHQYIVL